MYIHIYIYRVNPIASLELTKWGAQRNPHEEFLYIYDKISIYTYARIRG